MSTKNTNLEEWLAYRFRKVRKHIGLSQRKMGEEIGKSKSTVVRIEESRSPIHLADAVMLSKITNQSLDDLFNPTAVNV